MNARAFAKAAVLLSLPVMMGQGGGLPADPPPRGGPAQDAIAGGDRTQRIRELIYFFRNYRVFSRDEEWAQTIRELTTIGKDAVPELVAELDRTDRDATLRSLGFTLRAIGDPRAVPALIRAIPKTLRPPGSDCGITIADPDLRAFMLKHQNDKDNRSTSVPCGRPINEIMPALERITGHHEPITVRVDAFLQGTPEQQSRQRAMFENRRKHWERWWSEHWREFVTEEELRSVELPKRDIDVVEQAWVARHGMLFPTGPEVWLGPVRMLRLTLSVYMNGRSHLDLDTGRVFTPYEGMKAADWGKPDEFSSRVHAWYRQNGIDLRCQGPVDGVDVQLWQIDNSRWDTLEAEIKTGEPLRLGPEASHYLVRTGKSRNEQKPNETATFLLTTREGGRGIIQVFPMDPDADRYRVRYRMWSTAEALPAAAEPRKVKAPGTSFGEVVTTTMGRATEGRACLMDLDTGRKAVPPEILKPHEIAEATSLPRNDQFARWCRDQGIDLFVATIRIMSADAAPRSGLALIGLDMVEARIVPITFDECTVEETRELLERMPERRTNSVWMTIDDHMAERPGTFAFRTREGTVGLLQLEMAGKDAETLTIRYRLERRD